MAKQVIYELVDDIDGNVIEDGHGESIEFSLDGVDYVIDLRTKNANDLRKKLDYYVGYATRVGGRKRKVAAEPAAPTKRDPSETRAIRQWAADSGYEVNDRGRIPADIVEAYHAAH